MTGGVAYHRLQRTGPRGWWRPLVGVLWLLAWMLLAGIVVGTLAVFLETLPDLLTGASPEQMTDPFDDPGPILLAGLLLSLALVIPMVLLAAWALHGLRPGFMASVAGRIRWRYLGGCVGMSVLALIATVIVGALLPTGTREELTAQANPLDGRMVGLLLVALLVTPLQAAGEEYLFRGYFTQAFGGLVPDSYGRALPAIFAVLVPAALFVLAHGVQSWPVFVDRFAFGVVAGVLVILTGGLEAGIAMHVVNNWLAFGLAITLGDLGEALQPVGGTWWTLPGTLVQSSVYLGLAVWLARRQGIAHRTTQPL